MFEALTDKLQGAFRRLGSRGTINEQDLDEALREVRLALLEADVNFKVVREFVQGVKEQALGSRVLSSLTPMQQIIDIVHQQLMELLGGDFVIDGKGIVRFAYRSEDPADRPAMDRLLQAVRSPAP